MLVWPVYHQMACWKPIRFRYGHFSINSWTNENTNHTYHCFTAKKQSSSRFDHHITGQNNVQPILGQWIYTSLTSLMVFSSAAWLHFLFLRCFDGHNIILRCNHYDNLITKQTLGLRCCTCSSIQLVPSFSFTMTMMSFGAEGIVCLLFKRIAILTVKLTDIFSTSFNQGIIPPTRFTSDQTD